MLTILGRYLMWLRRRRVKARGSVLMALEDGGGYWLWEDGSFISWG